MAESYDGDIQLSVSLDPKSVAQSATSLTNKISQIFKATEGRDVDSGFKKLLTSMDKAQTKAIELKKKLEDLQAKDPNSISESAKEAVQEYAKLQKQIEAIDNVYKYGVKDKKIIQVPDGEDFDHYAERIQARYEEIRGIISQLPAELPVKEQEKLTAEIEKSQTALEKVNNEMRRLLDKTVGDYQMFDFEAVDSPELRNVIENALDAKASVEDLETAITAVRSRIEELDTDGDDWDVSYEARTLTVLLNELESRYREAANAGEELATANEQVGESEEAVANAEQSHRNQMSGMIEDMQNIAQQSDSVKQKMGSLAATISGFLAGQFTAPIRKLGDSLLNLGKSASTSEISVKKLFRTFLRYGLGVRSLFYLFRKLRSAISEGFKNLQQFNGGVNPVATTMNSLSASLTTLKNAWAAAFAPILQFVAPILQTLINLLISAANAVGQFFAALGGQSKVIRATKAQQNLGKAIGGTGAAADKAKGQLAAFDELNLLDQDSGSGGGGGGGAGIGDMGFEEVDVESKFKDLVDKIKEAWKNADFTEIGAMVGQKIKEALDIAYEWLTGPVQDFAWRLAKSLATFLNGVIEVPELGTSIGKVIAAAINDGFLFVNTFLKEFHWDSLGRLVGETIQAGFREFDWGNISRFVSRKFVAIFDAIRGFIEGIDWGALPKDIWDAIVEFVQGIEVKDLALSLAKLIRAAFKAVGDFGIGLWEGIFDTIFDIKSYFERHIKDAQDAGGNWFDGILDGIWEAVQNVGGWLLENVADPIIQGLSGGLIQSAAELGSDIWEGILGIIFDIGDYFDKYIQEAEDMGAGWIGGIFIGIVEALGNAAKWVWDNVCQPLVDGFKDFFGIHSPSTLMEELGGDIMEGLFNGITGLINKILEIWENLKTKIVEIVTSIGEKVKEKWNAIKTAVVNIVTNLKTSLSTTWNNIKTTVIGVIEKLKSGAVEKFNSIKSKLSEIATSIKTKLSSAFTAVKTTVTGIFNGMKTNVTNAFSRMWDGIRSPVNKILGGIETMANGVVRGINRIIQALNGLSFDVPDWVPKALGGGSSFGIHLNQIGEISLPRLAQGGVIPPNNEFLAVLGDQKHGTNIETPVETMKQAFREVLGESGTGNSEMVQLLQELITVVESKNLTISRREIGDSAIDEINRRTRRTGNTPILG